MAIFYGIACLLSIILLIAYFFVDRKRDVFLMLLFISVVICNTGYLLLSVSSNLTEALLGNSIAYLGNVFLPFFMLMILLRICYIKQNKKITLSLVVLGIVILFIATSGGYLPIYYKEVSFEIINGVKKLVKVYGPLHLLYYVYLCGYFVSMIVVIVYSILKGKIKSTLHAIFVSVIVFGNIMVWLIEQFIPHNFEFLSISYIMNECLLLLFYGVVQELELVRTNKMKENIKYSNHNADSINIASATKFTEEDIEKIFVNYKKLQTLTPRENEVIKLIYLDEKRKDIASKLFITESAVKKHTRNIYSKLQVENRKELYEKSKKYID